MKNTVLIIVTLAGTLLFSCKGKKTNSATENDKAETNSPAAASSGGSAASQASITVVASPDSAVLGKKNELVLKIQNIKALNLSDPDGKITGTEFTYDIQATNKNAIGDGAVYINPSDFRLELDNGTKISHETYNSVSVAPESTGSSLGNKFEIASGLKPAALDLFYDGTRAVIKLQVK